MNTTTLSETTFSAEWTTNTTTDPTLSEWITNTTTHPTLSEWTTNTTTHPTLSEWTTNTTAHPTLSNDMEIAETMHWVTSTVVGTIFVVMGLIGNSLSIIVWCRKSMRSSTGTYLIAQAIADIGLLVFFFITDSLIMMQPKIALSHSYGVFFCYIGYPVFFLFVVCSIWMTVGVTVDRYIQVCWVGRSKDMCSYKRALTGIGIITFLCFVINTPHFKTFHPVVDAKTKHAYSKTDFGMGPGSQHYEFWVHCMFLVLVPWLTIFTLNMLIIRKVGRMNRKMVTRRSTEGKVKAKKSQAQMTKLLLTVTFTFLVLIALQCITQCFFMLQPKSANMRIVSEAFAIAKLGIVINSSINFFLYCLSSERFRKQLRVVLTTKYAGMRKESYSLKETSSSLLSGSNSKSGGK